MKRIFEHTKKILKTPMTERVTIEGESVFSEIIDHRTDKAFTSWTCTLQSMGHKSEKALIDILKMFHYKEVVSVESVD